MRNGRAALACAAAAVLCCACREAPHGTGARRMIVIGVDGMDPGFVERHQDALPNLCKLRDTGSFQRLRTTTPPQSPVAWSTFITGLDPSGHGIYDFVHRDPRTMSPYSSMDRTEPARFVLPLGQWMIPLSKAHVVSLRRGVPFWKRLADVGIPVTMIRMPTNYPPVDAGRALAGMGVPDLRGGFGTFTLFTDDPEEITRTVSGGSIVKIAIENGRVTLPIEGAPNSLRRDQRMSSVMLNASVDCGTKAVRLTLGDSVTVLNQGEWSDWISAEFPLAGRVAGVTGMFRLFAKQVAPRFQLYVTPVNIDPRDPALPVSTPKGLSKEIADEIGPFYTQGIAEDTAALRQGVFDLPEFMTQNRLVFEDERRLMHYSLEHYRGGLLFIYFSVVDQGSHMLWGRHEQELESIYRGVDEAIGEAMDAARGAEFLVMSDHGFTRFDRTVQLNSWLHEHGYLVLSGPAGGEGFANVDWSRTRAYGLGLNGLYLNLRGREKNGIVDPRERPSLLQEIRSALSGLRDPSTGARVVQALASPPESSTAPDLIVGYSPGYRASWDTALGATAGPVLQDNNDAWIGDHCIDPSAVPGALFSSRKIARSDPSLRDLPGEILQFFGVPAN